MSPHCQSIYCCCYFLEKKPRPTYFYDKRVNHKKASYVDFNVLFSACYNRFSNHPWQRVFFVCFSLKPTFECRPEKLPDAPLAEALLADVLLLDIPLAEVPKPLEPEPREPEVAEPVPEQESSWRMMSSMSLDVEMTSLLLPSSLLCRKTQILQHWY